MKKNMKHRVGYTKSAGGFTLVELAIVVAVMGIAAYAMVNAYLTLGGNVQKNRTQLHFDVIEDALSAYAARNFRLPCPMRPDFDGMTEPYGYEAGSGPNGGNIPANCPEIEGIVPFMTLGLPEEYIRDGQGYFITYRIARSHGRDATIAADVHENCRSTPWMEQDMSGTDRNINEYLALFCCRAREGGNDALYIEFRPTITSGPQDIWRLPVDNAPARYAAVNIPTGSYPDDSINRNTIRPIYVLVAHGSGGRGSFNLSGNGNRIDGFMGTDEQINASTGSSQFRTGQHIFQQNSTNYYDDLVNWGTQDSLLARGMKYSCHAPSRP